jgi:hypothetical protein
MESQMSEEITFTPSVAKEVAKSGDDNLLVSYYTVDE